MIVESGIRTKLLSGIAAAALVLALGACSSGDDKPKASRETVTSEQTTTTFATTEPAAHAESGDYVNGEHMARVTAFDQSHITFDAVQFLTGDQAAQAFHEDHPGDEMDTDYYIRNQNPALRTLPLADGFVIRVNTVGGYEPSDDHEVTPKTFESYMKSGDIDHAYFWLTIHAGRVTDIDQQYIA